MHKALTLQYVDCIALMYSPSKFIEILIIKLIDVVMKPIIKCLGLNLFLMKS